MGWWPYAVAGGMLATLFLVWLVLELKTSRPDGTPIKVHPYRKLMAFVMRGRNESIVFFDSYIPADEITRYLEVARGKFGANLTHAVVAAVSVAIAENPPLNRFTVGKRLYQRKGRHITFSMKRQKANKKAKLAAVKLKMDNNESFRELAERINSHITIERSGKKTYADKEFALFNAVPRPILELAVTLFKLADYYNMLPGSFIESDGMYTSCFVANLGSLQMGAGYHHLYEWGNCPIFVMVGQVEDRPAVVNGEVVAQSCLHVRYSMDERIADGINARVAVASMGRVLRDPFKELGCLADDGSDRVSLGPKAEE
ncbi:MAG: hypothetical protein ACI9MC_000105 [Kiritimatiellia bacterium]|jgi:hypothetical protein